MDMRPHSDTSLGGGGSECREYYREAKESETEVVWTYGETKNTSKERLELEISGRWYHLEKRRVKVEMGEYVNRDMRIIGTTKDEVHDRSGWACVCCSDPTTGCEWLEEQDSAG